MHSYLSFEAWADKSLTLHEVVGRGNLNMESVNFVAFKWVDPFLKKTGMRFAWTHYKFSLKCSKQKWTIKPYEKSFRLSMKIDIKSVNKHCFSAFRNKPIFYVRINLHYSFLIHCMVEQKKSTNAYTLQEV